MGLCCSRGSDGFRRPRFRFIDGRRYHNIENTEYFVPNDNPEMVRLSEGHFVAKHLWNNRNFRAPVEGKMDLESTRVLDIGCGPGTWVLDCATKFPKARFTGVDISPIFPETPDLRNSDFLEANVLEGLPFEDNTFDFVHQRLLIAGYTKAQWTEVVIPEIIRILKPGGYAEFYEGLMPASDGGTVINEFSDTVAKFMASRNLDPFIAKNLKGLLQSYPQFRDVTELIVDGVYGKKAGEYGEKLLEMAVRSFEAVKPVIVAANNITAEEFDQLMVQYRDQMEKHYTYNRLVRVYAQKVDNQ